MTAPPEEKGLLVPRCQVGATRCHGSDLAAGVEGTFYAGGSHRAEERIGAKSLPLGAGMIDAAALAARVDLLGLIGADTRLAKVAGTAGGEYAGACPWCGGKDYISWYHTSLAAIESGGWP